MSRSVYLGWKPDDVPQVVHRVTLWDNEGYGGAQQSVPDLIHLLRDAEASLLSDGIPAEVIRVELDHDSEPDYGSDRIVPKLVMIGSRPATEQEVAQERDRQAMAVQARNAQQIEHLRRQLAALEGK